jgi:hypothetical protein
VTHVTSAYPRGIRGPVVPDVMLTLAWFVMLFLQKEGPFRTFMLIAVPAVIAWGVVTLHFPSRVELDDEGVSFSHYGRTHRFAWRDVTRVRVRRFLVRDRVVVRLAPTSAWRGKYWIFDSIEGFDALVAALEARATR